MAEFEKKRKAIDRAIKKTNNQLLMAEFEKTEGHSEGHRERHRGLEAKNMMPK